MLRRKGVVVRTEKFWFQLIMTDETMLPREGLFDRHLNNSTKSANINSIRPASWKRLTEKKMYLHGTLL